LFSSIPFAFIGGSLPIDKSFFEILLFIVLSTAGFLLLFKFKSFDDTNEINKKFPKTLSVLIGGSIGFISGVVGIGGGIFLSPILFLINAGKAKHIATAASIFILINSIAGLAGQLTKNFIFNEIDNYWPLFLLVLIGGQLGNYLNIKIFPSRILALITAGLVIFVAIRMGIKLFV
jgi:uncharacterized membrane protein YfcA